MTPTRSRPAIFTPVAIRAGERVGTFQRPYTKGWAVSTDPGSAGGGEQLGSFRDALFSGDERVLMLDGNRPDPAALLQRCNELTPPGCAATAADHGEVPRQSRRIVWPPPVEQPIEVQVGSCELHVFAVGVPGPVADRGHDRQRIHPHPEKVAGIDVGGDGVAERRDPVECLHVVDGCPGMKLQTDEKLWMLARHEFRDFRPVGLDPFSPLELVDRLEIRQPFAAREVWRAVPTRSWWAARKGDDAVDAEQSCQPYRVAQVGVVLARDRLVGVQRVA